LKEIDAQVEKAKRNAAQGDLGRSLAMAKLAEAKTYLSNIKTNFAKEAV
jgi:hypothetical protein